MQDFTRGHFVQREMGVIKRMRGASPIRRSHMPRAIATFAALTLVLLGSSIGQAAILLPDQPGFSDDDLARSLSSSAASGAGSSSHRSDSNSSPSNEDDKASERLGLLQGHLPSGGTSTGGSSTSSSSSGNNTSAGAIGSPINSAIALRDNSPLGRLPEDHGLSLPDPPGTDLLRPPRA